MAVILSGNSKGPGLALFSLSLFLLAGMLLMFANLQATSSAAFPARPRTRSLQAQLAHGDSIETKTTQSEQRELVGANAAQSEQSGKPAAFQRKRPDGAKHDVYMMFNIRQSQYGNQLHAVYNAARVARAMGWILVLPPFIPNGAESFQTSADFVKKNITVKTDASAGLPLEKYLDFEQLSAVAPVITKAEFLESVLPSMLRDSGVPDENPSPTLDFIYAVCKHWKAGGECDEKYFNGSMRPYYLTQLGLELKYEQVDSTGLNGLSHCKHAWSGPTVESRIFERVGKSKDPASGAQQAESKEVKRDYGNVKLVLYDLLYSPAVMHCGACLPDENAIASALIPGGSLRKAGAMFLEEMSSGGVQTAVHLRVMDTEYRQGIMTNGDAFSTNCEQLMKLGLDMCKNGAQSGKTNAACNGIYLARSGRFKEENPAVESMRKRLEAQGIRIFELNDFLDWIEKKPDLKAPLEPLLRTPVAPLMIDMTMLIVAPHAVFKSSSSWTPMLTHWRTDLIKDPSLPGGSLFKRASQPSTQSYSFHPRRGSSSSISFELTGTGARSVMSRIATGCK